jgi:Protein of unknown function (DUF3592)
MTLVRYRFVLLCALFFIGGMIFLAIAFRMYWLEWQYHFNAQKTDGIVLSKWRVSNSITRRGGPGGTSKTIGLNGGGVTYMIRYKYHTPPNGLHEDEDNVSPSYWEQSKPGDLLQVFYLPRAPGHSRLSQETRSALPLMLTFLGAIMTFLGVLGEFFVVADLHKKYVQKSCMVIF